MTTTTITIQPEPGTEYRVSGKDIIGYSDGSTQAIVRGVDRPDLGTVVRYSDGSVETVIDL